MKIAVSFLLLTLLVAGVGHAEEHEKDLAAAVSALHAARSPDETGTAIDRILAVVREAGGGPQDIGRMTIYTTDMPSYLSSRADLGAAYREAMGSHYPAMALVEVNELVDKGAIVEIEATAVIPENEDDKPERRDEEAG